MSDNKYSVSSVNWPVTDIQTEAAIGRVVIAWSVLDRQIDDALRLVLRCSPEVGVCVSANLGAQAKLDIFLATTHTLFHVTNDELGEEISDNYRNAMIAFARRENAFIADLEALVADTKTKAVEFRNWMAHGQPHLLVSHEGCNESDHWIWVKSSARKGGVKLNVRKLTPEAFETASADIQQLVEKWNNVLKLFPSRMDILDAAEAAWRGEE